MGFGSAVIVGLIFAVVAGILADLLSFHYSARIWTVKISAMVGGLFGLRFGIHNAERAISRGHLSQ